MFPGHIFPNRIIPFISIYRKKGKFSNNIYKTVLSIPVNALKSAIPVLTNIPTYYTIGNPSSDVLTKEPLKTP